MNISSHKKGAAILIVVLFFVILSVTILIGISMPITQQIENTSDFLASKKTFNVADMQAENTIYRLNKGKTDAPGTISVLGSSATAIFTDVGDEKQISIQGLFGEFERYVQARFKQDTGVAFNYGLQTGTGGLQMSGSAYITGNVYSNGDIVGNGGSGWYTTYITGSAISATIANPVPQIENVPDSSPTHIQKFGLTNTNQDFAQSFVMSTTTPISEIQLYLKKTGSPANATVKIVTDNGSGAPGSTVKTSATLSAALVTSAYAYVPVVPTSNTSLIVGTTYWIVIDVPSNSSSNYYTIGMNNNVFSGNTKQGKYGSTMTNLTTTTADAGFRILVGGDSGSITGMGVGTSGTGEAWAKNIVNTTVTGSLFCQTGTGNNKACDTSRLEPVPAALPISTGNVDEWKTIATAGGATSSVIIDGVKVGTFGPLKINGNLEVGASGKLYITGPIYVTGNVKVEGSGKIYVDSSLGTESGIIVSDGTLDIQGSGGIYGSGAPGSYVVIATTSSCPWTPSCSSGSSYAINISGASGSVVLVAQDGKVKLEGSVGIKSLVAKLVEMSGTAHIVYESGLADLSFSSGPSGSWTLTSWKEALGL